MSLLCTYTWVKTGNSSSVSVRFPALSHVHTLPVSPLTLTEIAAAGADIPAPLSAIRVDCTFIDDQPSATFRYSYTITYRVFVASSGTRKCFTTTITTAEAALPRPVISGKTPGWYEIASSTSVTVLRNAYWRIFVCPDHVEATECVTSNGKYYYQLLSYGVRTVLKIYTEMVHTRLSRISELLIFVGNLFGLSADTAHNFTNKKGEHAHTVALQASRVSHRSRQSYRS